MGFNSGFKGLISSAPTTSFEIPFLYFFPTFNDPHFQFTYLQCSFHYFTLQTWTGKLRRYSDWLRTGRPGDRIPVGGVRFSTRVQTGPGANPASCIMGTVSFPGVKSGRGVTLTPHSLVVPWLWKSRAIPLLPPMGRPACTEPQCLYKGDLYLYFYRSIPTLT